MAYQLGLRPFPLVLMVLSAGSLALSTGSMANSAGFEALSAGSVALPAGSEALYSWLQGPLARSEALQPGQRLSQLDLRLT